MSDLRIAIVGAGIIGHTHAATLADVRGVALSAVVDPIAGADVAERHGVPLFTDVGALLDAGVADAAIVASPNDTHVPITSALLRAGLPVLLEKPVANSVADGEALIAVAEETGVPVLVGHHRRHNPIIKAAKAAITAGRLGDLVTATVNSTLAKPSSYFDVAWRRGSASGGPLSINLIHEIDLLRHFWGEVAEVRAFASNHHRGFDVEDTAAAILVFASGGIATLTISDAATGPWAWDVTAGENPARFPAHDTIAHAYAGTLAALSLPDLAFWRPADEPDWTVRMTRGTLPCTPADPYIGQIEHFAAVARGNASPLVSLADGVANMRVIEAIKTSAANGAPAQPMRL
ncbi:Gfo/Idh/MocA family protein [Sinisalibacter lacisalsi]|uniref:Oxidoreductase n=1 Tax=Sinisalibacter lacisalsi TaxID=1526570 RepID=A0ABQ1QFP2_9RHOB|nr:Gfo/Idh/MocA family oxidoreductase [Sinisalibacter lacisalsi]GGD25179.1 oxidoreductase [Sinisalibacter lacisalsi]